MANYPIWRDTTYEASSAASPLTYSLVMENGTVTINGVEQTNYETVFNGKAWCNPKASAFTINVSRLAQDYLSMELPDIRGLATTITHTHDEAFRHFYLYDDNNALLGSYNFLMDWSYDSSRNYTTNLDMSNPINGKYVNGMIMFSTIWNTSAVTSTISPSASAITDGNGNLLYTEEGCGDWALYYLNRYGGWDSFLIENKVTKKDSYEKYYIDNSVENTTFNFGRKAYHNQITTSWELNTGWLKDSQSENLAFNLLSSNQVYLHDLVNNKLYPVILTDAETTYKTFKNQNHKLYTYTINVQGSQLTQNIG